MSCAGGMLRPLSVLGYSSPPMTLLQIALSLLLPIAIGVGGMIMAGDLRVTRKQQREWEERWGAISPEERERIARNYWA
jgi:hypothetical protein